MAEVMGGSAVFDMWGAMVVFLVVFMVMLIGRAVTFLAIHFLC